MLKNRLHARILGISAIFGRRRAKIASEQQFSIHFQLFLLQGPLRRGVDAVLEAHDVVGGEAEEEYRLGLGPKLINAPRGIPKNGRS